LEKAKKDGRLENVFGGLGGKELTKRKAFGAGEEVGFCLQQIGGSVGERDGEDSGAA